MNLNTSVVGEGVRLASTAQQFNQGNISTTSSNLDLAISGDGFFTLKDASGLVYSRNGQFAEDKNGNIVSATGQALQVYPPLVNGGFNTGTLSDLNLQSAQSAPLASFGRHRDPEFAREFDAARGRAVRSDEFTDLQPVDVDVGL